jgi:hypothetical protein
MLGSIAGDIIGSRFEGRAGAPRDFALFHPACRFTDDTVCGLAVANALLSDRDFATSLRDFVRRHPRRGYGGMFLDWALSDDAPAYGSWGNGAPMRVAAVGWLARDEIEARDLAAAQAAVSHNHPDAMGPPRRSLWRSSWRALPRRGRSSASGSSRNSATIWRRSVSWVREASMFRRPGPFRRADRRLGSR